jgi:hypothetical protein
MKALINPNESAKYVISWERQGFQLIPTFENIGAKVCQISDVDFEVASPLFWVDCDATINDTIHYYDLATNSFKEIPANVDYVPQPATDQPTTNGTQTI